MTYRRPFQWASGVLTIWLFKKGRFKAKTSSVQSPLETVLSFVNLYLFIYVKISYDKEKTSSKELNFIKQFPSSFSVLLKASLVQKPFTRNSSVYARGYFHVNEAHFHLNEISHLVSS